MRSSKQSDSPSGYCRDVYRERVRRAQRTVSEQEEYERTLRKRERARIIGSALVQPDDLYRDSYGVQVPNEDIAVEGLW